MPTDENHSELKKILAVIPTFSQPFFSGDNTNPDPNEHAHKKRPGAVLKHIVSSHIPVFNIRLPCDEERRKTNGVVKKRGRLPCGKEKAMNERPEGW